MVTIAIIFLDCVYTLFRRLYALCFEVMVCSAVKIVVGKALILIKFCEVLYPNNLM